MRAPDSGFGHGFLLGIATMLAIWGAWSGMSARQDHPRHIADLPKKGMEEWMTMQIKSIDEDRIQVIGCPAKNPVYGPVTFEIVDQELANAAVEEAYVPILSIRTNEGWKYVGFAAVDRSDGPGSVGPPSDVRRDEGADAPGGSGNG